MPQSKYAELLAIIEELGKEIRPTYAGSKSAMERLKRGESGARAPGRWHLVRGDPKALARLSLLGTLLGGVPVVTGAPVLLSHRRRCGHQAG